MCPDLRTLLCLLLASGAASPAIAAPPDAPAPIQIEADRADITEQSGASVYSGNVSLRQGDLEMEGERLEISRDGEQGEIRALLTGNPARLTQPTDQGETVNARAQRIEYQSRTRSIDLKGDAEFVRGRDRVSGQSIRYDASARKLQASGPSPGGSRVRIVIQPEAPRNPAQ